MTPEETFTLSRVGGVLGLLLGIGAANLYSRYGYNQSGSAKAIKGKRIPPEAVDLLREHYLLPRDVPIYFGGSKLDIDAKYISPAMVSVLENENDDVRKFFDKNPGARWAARKYGIVLVPKNPNIHVLLSTLAEGRGFYREGSLLWARIKDLFDVPVVMIGKPVFASIRDALIKAPEVYLIRRYLDKKTEDIVKNREVMEELRNKYGITEKDLLEMDEKLLPSQKRTLITAALVLLPMIAGYVAMPRIASKFIS